ncbi:MAG: hypothetical protein K0R82_371 [Flavipsychrobacter sp.]|jgi:SAM-dependent methyltransferase|nr:hypothetical protein [Flavipsychrobacter sp.]
MNLPVAEIIEWDVLNWAQLIQYWQPVVSQLPPNSNVLTIGERNGGLTSWLALLGHNVVCTDRNFPTEKARINHKRLGISQNITYGSLDIVDCDWRPASFDLIVCKSVIGGLKADPADRTTRNFDVQVQAVNNIYGLLKTDGYFLSAENMRGAGLMQYYRKVKHKETGWRYLSWDEIGKLYSQFNLRRVEAFGVIPTNFRSVLVNNSCFFLNKYILNYLPRNYKYISFITAQKIN